jgi:hypothetical protein
MMQWQPWQALRLHQAPAADTFAILTTFVIHC